MNLGRPSTRQLTPRARFLSSPRVPSSSRKRRFDVSGSYTQPSLPSRPEAQSEFTPPQQQRAVISRYRSAGSRKASVARRLRGFTLLEVMIALLVISLGIGAVVSTTSESGWKSAQLKQKTIASWVAQNQIALYRAKRTWNNASTRSGQVDMANATWVYQMKISTTDDPGLRKIEVDVLLKGEDGVKASVTGFIGKL